MSGAGKSLITAALCRIFTQDGYRTAPFKSQNMALNSFVTGDGLEMGRAQAVQALAAGKKPDVRMNPILLKPSSETGSQVILNGRIFGQYSAADYFRIKKQLVPHILEAYEGLAGENDIIVIEGAGSPAEINLRSGDIVNMGLAEMVDARVLLAGNIDPGGVFAQLYGTVGLLKEAERSRIAGFIINKFRGDRELLSPGLKELYELTGIPVVGVLPYMSVKLSEEDSLSGELSVKQHEKPVDIAVIRLPFISNYTDMTPLQRSPYLGVRYVEEASELGRPDLVILPGSKSTIDDLRWLKRTGLAAAVRALKDQGSDIMGICGGYQMLGERLFDPETGQSEEGLKLLSVRTVFKAEKRTTQVKARIENGELKGLRLSGYEIHTGETAAVQGDASGMLPFMEFDVRGERYYDGFILENVCGTYLHGLFENGELIDRLGRLYFERRGLSFCEDLKTGDYEDFQEKQYDLLADTVRKNLDMKAIYGAIGLK